ncbi:MAG: hypothetical protein IKQ39_00760 [Oscillospiraceae bacterium]|nr:hypothetical protein [Oscillospiraceae bacterium]
MVCKVCGRNNPEGQYTCIGCSAVLGSSDSGMSNGMPGVSAPSTYSSSAFPTPMPSSAPYSSPTGYTPGSFVTSAKKQLNVFGLVAALLYALSALLKFATVTVEVLGFPYSESVRLIPHAAGFVVIGLAAAAIVASINRNNLALIGTGALALVHMLYRVVTFDNYSRDVLNELNSELSGYDYSEYLSIDITKDGGFWLLVFGAVMLLVAGVVSLILDKKEGF